WGWFPNFRPTNLKTMGVVSQFQTNQPQNHGGGFPISDQPTPKPWGWFPNFRPTNLKTMGVVSQFQTNQTLKPWGWFPKLKR
ncbi:hypothetical protein R7P65_19510, partial [Vibrio sp. Vb0718]|uniref:hypothetical protein n=1 Tax=Vibrio sp. Vb0718 TaxID=3074630 RepID=UPI002964A4AC